MPDDSPGPAQQVRVLFFASAREAAGSGEASLPWAGRAAAELRDLLAGEFGPDLARILASCALWVNASPLVPGSVLRAGDEVAVLPPVSGG